MVNFLFVIIELFLLSHLQLKRYKQKCIVWFCHKAYVWQMDGQNYDFQYCAIVAVLRGKNRWWWIMIYDKQWHVMCMLMSVRCILHMEVNNITNTRKNTRRSMVAVHPVVAAAVVQARVGPVTRHTRLGKSNRSTWSMGRNIQKNMYDAFVDYMAVLLCCSYCTVLCLPCVHDRLLWTLHLWDISPTRQLAYCIVCQRSPSVI